MWMKISSLDELKTNVVCHDSSCKLVLDWTYLANMQSA